MHGVLGGGQQRGVDRGERQPEAEAGRDQRHASPPGRARLVSPHCAIQTKPGRGQHHARPRSPPRRARGGSGSRRARAPDRQRDQQAHQHQRGDELGVGVDGEPGEDRDVHQGRDQRRPDEEADRAARPRPASRANEPCGHQRVRADPVVPARTPAAASAEPASSQGPAGEKTETSRVGGGEGQDHPGQARRRAGPRRAGRPRRASRAPGAHVDQRRPGGAAGAPRAPRAAPSRASPTGVSQRESPATGTNARPSVTSVASDAAARASPGCSATTASPARRAPTTSNRPVRAGSGARGPAPGGSATASTRPTARLSAKIACQVRDGEHHRAVQRAEHAAELLDRADHAERDAAAGRRVEVGDQRERGRHQPTGADALEEPAGHHAWSGRRRRR